MHIKCISKCLLHIYIHRYLKNGFKLKYWIFEDAVCIKSIHRLFGFFLFFFIILFMYLKIVWVWYIVFGFFIYHEHWLIIVSTRLNLVNLTVALAIEKTIGCLNPLLTFYCSLEVVSVILYYEFPETSTLKMYLLHTFTCNMKVVDLRKLVKTEV